MSLVVRKALFGRGLFMSAFPALERAEIYQKFKTSQN